MRPMFTTKLKPGSAAPAFRLQDQDGRWTELSELLKDGPALLVFYPGDFTPVCTRQLCSYQGQLDQFRGLGVRVVGISSDPIEKHQEFRKHYGLAFTLLADPRNATAKAYGVNTLGLGGLGRGLFLVDRSGKIVWSQMEVVPVTHRNADELLEVLKGLQGQLG